MVFVEVESLHPTALAFHLSTGKLRFGRCLVSAKNLIPILSSLFLVQNVVFSLNLFNSHSFPLSIHSLYQFQKSRSRPDFWYKYSNSFFNLYNYYTIFKKIRQVYKMERFESPDLTKKYKMKRTT